MRHKERRSELIDQPIVCPVVHRLHRRKRFLRMGQKQIAVAAAAVNQVYAAESTRLQHLVRVMLHQHFKEKRAAAKRLLRALRRNGVNEFLNAGKIRRVKRKHLFVAERLFVLKHARPDIRRALIQQIFADARADGRRDFQMIIKRNIRTFACVCARRHIGRAAFQQRKQRIQPRFGKLNTLQPLTENRQQCLILRCRNRRLSARQMQLSVMRAGFQRQARMFAIQVRKDRIKRQCAVKPRTLSLDLPPVRRGSHVIRHADDICRAVFRRIRPAQGRSMMPAHAVEHILPRRILQPFFQIRIARGSMIPVFARAVNHFADVMKQPAEYRLQCLFIQMTASRNGVHGKTQHVFCSLFVVPVIHIKV